MRGAEVKYQGTVYTKALIDLYVEMALQTKDKEWFMWLSNMKNYILDRERRESNVG